MPSAKNPSSITTGSGLAAQESVEPVSFVSPTNVGGLDGLEAHLIDPSRAHMAIAIGITDAADYFAADEVESALQEIGSTFATGSQNGVVSGGTFTSALLDVTLDPTVVRIGTNHDLSGELESLTDNATNWLYVDPTGTLTHSTGASSPSPFSPENVLLWKIVTLAGAITSYTDARFFVLNLDRKLPYTVRAEGTATNTTSEACFITLDAAMLWLGQFGSTAKKTKLIIRGSNTISSTVSLPVNDISIEGEDGAVFTTGAALNPMFEVATRSRITFKNISFVAAHAASTAIRESVGAADDLTISQCQFSSGAQPWGTAIYLQGTNTGTLVEHCSIAALTYGVRITKPANALLQHLRVSCTATTTGTAGVSLGDGAVALPYTGSSTIRDSSITGFTAGLILRGPNMTADSVTVASSVTGINVLTGSASVSIHNCYLSPDSVLGTTGIVLTGSSVVSVSHTKITSCISGITGNSTQVSIIGTQVLPSATLGMLGISSSGVGTEVTGCLVKMDRGAGTYGGADLPQGVILTGSQSSVTGTTVQGVYNSVRGLGDGITVATGSQFSLSGNTIETAANGYLINGSNVSVSSGSIKTCLKGVTVQTDTRNVLVTGVLITDITTAGVDLSGNIRDVRVTGCTIDGFLSGAPLLSTAEGVAISNIAANLPLFVSVSDNTIWRCKNGVVVRGTLANRPSKVHVTGNTIHHCGFAQDNIPPVDGFEVFPMGVGLNHADDCLVSGNLIYKIGQVIDNALAESFWTGGGTVVDNNSAGINVWNCSRARVSDNKISDTMANGTGQNYGIYVQQKSAGTVAAAFDTENIEVTGNSLVWASGLGGNGVANKGIVFDMLLGTDVNPSTYSCTNLSVSGNTVRRTRSNGIEVQSGAVSTLSNVMVDNNTVDAACSSGTSQTAGLNVGLSGGNALDPGIIKHVSVSSNTVRSSSMHGIFMAALQYGTYSDVQVAGNIVADSVMNGIFLQASTGSPGVITLKHWSIDENTVLEFASGAGTHYGIYILDTASSMGGIAKFTISKNRLESSVAAGTTLGGGIQIAVMDVSLWEFECSGNQILNPASMDGVTHFGGTGISLTTAPVTTVLGTSIFGLVVARNTVWTESANALVIAPQGIATSVHITNNFLGTDTGYPMRILCDSFAVFATDLYNGPFFITGNQCFGGSGSLFRVTNSTKLGATTITGNSFTDGSSGLTFQINDTYALGNPAIKSMLVANNSFRNIPNVGLQLSLGIGGAAVSAAMHQVVATGNSFYECGTAGGGVSTLAVTANAVVLNMKVSENSFYNCGGTTDDAGAGVVHLLFGSGGGVAAMAVCVDKNIFSDSGGCAIRVADRAAGAANWTIRGLTVSGNQVRNQTNDAIKIDLAAFTTVSQVSVTDNQIDTVSGAASDQGIVFLGPSAANVTNIVVSRNSVAAVGNGDAAVKVSIPQSATNLQIDQNTVSGGSVTVAGVYAVVGLLWRNGSVSGNTVLDSNAKAVYVSIPGTIAGTSGAYDLQVCNNQADSCADGVCVVGTAVTSTPVFRSVSLNGNSVRNSAGYGVQCEALLGTGVFGVSMSNNNVSGYVSTGVHFHHTGTTDLQNIVLCGNSVFGSGETGVSLVGTVGNTNVLFGVVVSSNTIVNCTREAIYVGATVGLRSFDALSIVGNAIKGWGTGAGTNYGAVKVQATDVKSFVLANNTAFTGVADSVAYWLILAGNAYDVAITGNTCDLQNAATTTSMLVDDSGSGLQAGWAITGNSFRGAATGVTALNTFAPAWSTVGYNNERTGGGGALGNWSVFRAVFTNSITLTAAAFNAPINQD